MTISRPLTARSSQKSPGQAWRNNVLADRADVPDDADKSDDPDECNKSTDSDDPPTTFWASCLSGKKSARPRIPRPGQCAESGQFLLTANCEMTIFRPLTARSSQNPPGQA